VNELCSPGQPRAAVPTWSSFISCHLERSLGFRVRKPKRSGKIPVTCAGRRQCGEFWPRSVRAGEQMLQAVQMPHANTEILRLQHDSHRESRCCAQDDKEERTQCGWNLLLAEQRKKPWRALLARTAEGACPHVVIATCRRLDRRSVLFSSVGLREARRPG